MPPAETDPIEKKSYTKALFVVGTLFFAVSLWAYLDEFVDRRSWKGYQNEFNTIELKKLQDEYAKAKQSIQAEDGRREQIPEGQAKEGEMSLRRIRLKIEEAEIRMEGKDFHVVEEDLACKNILLSDTKQKLGFTKADQDEIYYEWKHALEEDKEKESEKLKEEYYVLEKEIQVLKGEVGKVQADVDEVQKKLQEYHDELKKWQEMEKKIIDPLAKIEKKIKSVKSRSFDIQQVVINDLGKGGVIEWGTVDRCQSCHTAINRDGFENEKHPFKTHPFRAEIMDKHPPESFGCTTCHAGQGRATQIKHKPFEKGDFAHGYVPHWPDRVIKGDGMQASCNKCHQDQWELSHADVYLKGKIFFWDLGCTGCHHVEGFEEAPRVGPSLRKIGDKVSAEWMYAWIKAPHEYLPKTQMPTSPLDIEESGQTEKVMAYLFQKSETFDKPFGSYPGGNAEEGKKTFETVGCLGCHTMADRGTGLAPALDNIASKTTSDWIYNWIQDPKRYSATATMPDLRLTSSEAANITAYLIQQGEPLAANHELEAKIRDPESAKKGFLIISQFGCYGCHEIKGFEDTSKLSVDLSAIGKKELHELDFGDSKIPRTWDDWIEGKLKDPRMYLHERTSSKMPNFRLLDDQIHALRLFMKGLRREAMPERFLMTKLYPHQKEIDEGRRLTERLNCRGCHTIEGQGRLIETVVGADKTPPILDGIGARVRPDYLFAFLKNPARVKLRPWIDVRMPTFGFSDEDTNKVIHYFSGLSKVPSNFTTVPAEAPSTESLQAGMKLASPDYFNCFACHIQGGKTPLSSPEQWGPDLAFARERIRYDFIPEWVKDPQRFTPGVKMPAFLPSDDGAPQDVLGGDRQKQAEALRDYLMSLGGGSNYQE